MMFEDRSPKQLVELYFELVQRAERAKIDSMVEKINSPRSRDEMLRIINELWSKLPEAKFSSLANISNYRCTGDCATCRNLVNHMRDTYGHWIDSLAQWQIFATLTFDIHKIANGRDGWNIIGENFATHAFYNFIRELESYYAYDNQFIKELHTIEYVAGLETHKNGSYHIHCLIAGIDIENVYHLINHKRWWDNEYGYSKFVIYNKNKGAKYYICKYLVKEGNLLVKTIQQDDTRIIDLKEELAIKRFAVKDGVEININSIGINTC